MTANPKIPVDALITEWSKKTLDPAERAVARSKKTMQKLLYNKKKKILKRPPVPLNFNDPSLVTLPDHFTTTSDGERFLMFNDLVAGERILMFGSKAGLQLMQHANSWGSDGTFSTCPAPFFQVYVFTAELSGRSYSTIFCLLPNKKADTYRVVFEQLRIWLTKPNPVDTAIRLPELFIVDFESPVMKEFSKRFAGVKVSGCFAHFRRNLWKQLGVKGLQPLYSRNLPFCSLVKCLSSLAFVKPEEVQAYYQDLLENLMPKVIKSLEEEMEDEEDGLDTEDCAELKEMIDSYLAYFESTYCGTHTRTGYSKPLFPPNIWSHHAAALSLAPRSNNANENFNSHFRGALAVNSQLWAVIEQFVGEEAKVRVSRSEDLFKHQAGVRVEVDNEGQPTATESREKRRSLDLIKRRNLVSHKDEMSKLDYLQLLSGTFEYYSE